MTRFTENYFDKVCVACDGEGYIDRRLYQNKEASAKCSTCKGTGYKIPKQNVLPKKSLVSSIELGRVK